MQDPVLLPTDGQFIRGVMNKVLVLSPHPDDESLGCGGTLRKHVVEGDEVQIIFLTSGEQGGDGRPPEEVGKIREQEAKEAAAILGVSKIEFWRERNGEFHVNQRVIKRLRTKLIEWEPDIIYVTHDREIHSEHRAAARLVKRILSNGLSGEGRPDVFMFEIWTPLQTMNHIVDISPYIEVKRKAIQAHKSQCQIVDYDDALLALNRYRGEMHIWPGVDYAEVFVKLPKPKKTLQRS